MSELMFIEKGTFLQKIFTDFLKIVSSSYLYTTPWLLLYAISSLKERLEETALNYKQVLISS